MYFLQNSDTNETMQLSQEGYTSCTKQYRRSFQVAMVQGHWKLISKTNFGQNLTLNGQPIPRDGVELKDKDKIVFKIARLGVTISLTFLAQHQIPTPADPRCERTRTASRKRCRADGSDGMPDRAPKRFALERESARVLLNLRRPLKQQSQSTVDDTTRYAAASLSTLRDQMIIPEVAAAAHLLCMSDENRCSSILGSLSKSKPDPNPQPTRRRSPRLAAKALNALSA